MSNPRHIHSIAPRFSVLVLTSLLFLGAGVFHRALAREVAEIDRIVAVVGNEAITLSELNERLQTAVAQLRHQGIPLPEREVLARQMLERMIMDRSQLQEARDTGITVSDAQLEQTLDRMAAHNRITREQFQATLQKDGIPYARFREEIRENMVISRLRDREVDSRLTISEAEIDNFIAQSGADGEVVYHVAHILLRAPESASPAQRKTLQTKAEAVLERARRGESFAELAAAYSDGPDALQGGNLGWRPLRNLPTVFENAVGEMQPGETRLLDSANGFHIVQLLDKRGGALAVDGSVQQTHARHILIRSNEIVSESEARRRLEDVRERLRHGESFAELARLFSQDDFAASGGDLGWLNPGDTAPEFERAMDALGEGEISEVVRTPSGFHLILVEERRAQDLSQEKLRLAARRAIRERKMDEAYQNWLRQLRDRTYVEYRLEEE
ncbi:MAG: peptidylprolyl isomerase [Zoogloeaceae bacterium]|jgi:peptidyl-prolyl cis-trans isomerase SurA|nr:peptidylprolyl isomerase [Zoogloeaceae bacterium]